MKQSNEVKSTTIAPTNAPKSVAGRAQAKAKQKDWSVKMAVRLPHKVGLPLGSSASDGSSL